MTYETILQYIENRKPSGIQLGLERMETAAEALGQPQDQYPCIHIAGTKGKGSTAHLIAAALTNAGYTVGLYTSPVVTDILQTIQINNAPVERDTFANAASNVIEKTDHIGLSEFEFVTATAFEVFAQKKVDVAVVECGLGGLTDATNVITSPLCAVITPIALDHTDFLGDSIEAIARQKCGIIKNNCGVAYAPTLDDDALAVVFETGAAKGATLYTCSGAEHITVTAEGTAFDYQNHHFRLSLIGEHQADNALTALAALQHLQKNGFRVTLENAMQGFSDVTLPCRSEIVSEVPFVLLDAAHNPHSIGSLAATMKRLHLSPVTLVLGMLKDKDAACCVQQLAPLCKQIICCTPSHPLRALPASALAEIALQYHDTVTAINDPIEAFHYAKKTAEQTPVVVGGSFYTAGSVRRLFN